MLSVPTTNNEKDLGVPDDNEGLTITRNASRSSPNLILQLRQLIEEEDARISNGVSEPSIVETSTYEYLTHRHSFVISNKRSCNDQDDTDDLTTDICLTARSQPQNYDTDNVPLPVFKTKDDSKSRRWTQQTLEMQRTNAEEALVRLGTVNSGKIIKERILVLNEIMESEKSYVQYLELLYRMYYAPICECTEDPYRRDENDVHGVAPDMREAMFPPNFATILNVSKAFLEKLEERSRLYSDLPYFVTIGDIFAEMAPFLKVYVSYVTNYERAVRVIRKYRQKFPQFDQWLERRKRHPDSNGLDIVSLLIMPVQHVPRYLILLSALLDKTDAEHADHFLLEEARNAVTSVAEYQNSRIRDAKNTRRVQQISKRLRLKELVTPSRRIVREGKVNVRKSPYICYLFNDLIVLEQEEKRVSTPQCEVFSLLNSFISGGDETTVSLRVTEGEHVSVVDILCESNYEKNGWHDALLRVLGDLNERENDEVIRHVDDHSSVASVPTKRYRSGSFRHKLRLPSEQIRPVELPLQLTPRTESIMSRKRLSLTFPKRRLSSHFAASNTPTLSNSSSENESCKQSD